MDSNSDSSLTGPRLQFVHELSRGVLGERYLVLRASPAAPPQTLLCRAIPLAADGTGDGQRLRQAARTSLSFRHPNLIRVLGFEQTPCELLLLSQWVDGINLTNARKLLLDSESPTPLAIVVRLAIDLAESAALIRSTHPPARSMRLVWNDSTLLTPSGRVLLGEPGIIPTIADSEYARRSPLLVGELSPEELARNATSESTDVYAIGMLMWELLADRALLSQIQPQTQPLVSTQGLPSIADMRRGGPLLPKRLTQIVAKATTPDPDRRLRSPALLAAELEGLAPELKAKPTDVRALLGRLAGTILHEQRFAKERALSHDRSWFQQVLDQKTQMQSNPTRGTQPTALPTFASREAPTRPDRAQSCSKLRAGAPAPTPHTSGVMPARGAPKKERDVANGDGGAGRS